MDKSDVQDDHESVKNLIKVTKNRNFGRVLKYVWSILEKEKNFNSVILQGAGQAISNVVPLADLIR